MMSVSLKTSGSFTAGTPKVLFEGKYAAGLPGLPNYCVTPDGEGFLMVKPLDPALPPTRLEVVLNWVEELKRLRSGMSPR